MRLGVLRKGKYISPCLLGIHAGTKEVFQIVNVLLRGMKSIHLRNNHPGIKRSTDLSNFRRHRGLTVL